MGAYPGHYGSNTAHVDACAEIHGEYQKRQPSWSVHVHAHAMRSNHHSLQ